jgi:hypothetical protein
MWSRENRKFTELGAIVELGSRDVEELLGDRLGLDPARRIAFRGRFDHLRKLGCPTGVKTGRGRAAVFGWTQIIQLAVALDLINLGMTPDNAAAFIKANHEFLNLLAHRLTQSIGSKRTFASAVAEEKWPFDKTLFLLIDIRALAAFKPDGSTEATAMGFQDGKSMLKWLKAITPADAANILIDFGTKIAQLLNFVSAWAKSDVESVVADFSEWADQSSSRIASDLAGRINQHVDP